MGVLGKRRTWTIIADEESWCEGDREGIDNGRSEWKCSGSGVSILMESLSSSGELSDICRDMSLLVERLYPYCPADTNKAALTAAACSY